jgi:hypothetical protein
LELAALCPRLPARVDRVFGSFVLFFDSFLTVSDSQCHAYWRPFVIFEGLTGLDTCYWNGVSLSRLEFDSRLQRCLTVNISAIKVFSIRVQGPRVHLVTLDIEEARPLH